jgi:hypothetical protein
MHEIEFGEVILQTIMRGEGLRIVAAPESVLISEQFVNPEPGSLNHDERISIADEVVTIKASNMTVHYRLSHYRPFELCYEAHRIEVST